MSSHLYDQSTDSLAWEELKAISAEANESYARVSERISSFEDRVQALHIAKLEASVPIAPGRAVAYIRGSDKHGTGLYIATPSHSTTTYIYWSTASYEDRRNIVAVLPNLLQALLARARLLRQSFQLEP
jgi:hypothetical protein